MARKPNTKTAKAAAADKPAAQTMQSGQVELKDDDLDKVTGGMLACAKPNPK